MRTITKSAIFTVTLLGLALGAVPADGDGHGTRQHQFTQERQRRTAKLRRLAEELREAVLRQDGATLLKYATDNETIGNRTYDDRKEFRELLADPKSHLSCFLFDTQCQLEILQKGDPRGSNPYRIAVRDFFRQHDRVNIKIYFLGKKTPKLGIRGLLDLAEIAYVVPGTALDRSFPDPRTTEAPLRKWGAEYLDTCLQYTAKGWRYYAASIFACPTD